MHVLAHTPPSARFLHKLLQDRHNATEGPEANPGLAQGLTVELAEVHMSEGIPAGLHLLGQKNFSGCFIDENLAPSPLVTGMPWCPGFWSPL